MTSRNPLKFGSLFSGIGGFDLGFERARMECAWQVENDPWCNQILAKHWPEVPKYGDVRDLSGSDLAPVDVICGGFPCQPVSVAGKRKAQADERWLWPEFARLVDEIRPRFVVVENVPGLYTAGGTEVFTDLAALGFDAEWHCIPAAAVGAPHLRWRVFIVAHTSRPGGGGVGGMASHIADEGGGTSTTGFEMVRPSNGDTRTDRAGTSSEDVAHSQDALRGTGLDNQDNSSIRSEGDNKPGGSRSRQDVADTDRSTRQPEGGAGQTVFRSGTVERPGRRGSSFGQFWAVEPGVGRVAHGIPRRVDRLRGLGNAVIPQITEIVGKYVVRLEEDLYE